MADQNRILQEPECPPGCCTGTEILCVSIPCPINIVLLGIDLTLNLPCLSLNSTTPLTSAQIAQLLGTLGNLVGAIGGVVPAAPAQEA